MGLELPMVFLFEAHSELQDITLSHCKGTADEVWIAAISHGPITRISETEKSNSI
jgi:hypothetical protein